MSFKIGGSSIQSIKDAVKTGDVKEIKNPKIEGKIDTNKPEPTTCVFPKPVKDSDGTKKYEEKKLTEVKLIFPEKQDSGCLPPSMFDGINDKINQKIDLSDPNKPLICFPFKPKPGSQGEELEKNKGNIKENIENKEIEGLKKINKNNINKTEPKPLLCGGTEPNVGMGIGKKSEEKDIINELKKAAGNGSKLDTDKIRKEAKEKNTIKDLKNINKPEIKKEPILCGGTEPNSPFGLGIGIGKKSEEKDIINELKKASENGPKLDTDKIRKEAKEQAKIDKMIREADPEILTRPTIMY